jgi:hypothetical protein
VIVESPDISRKLKAVRAAVERTEAPSREALCRNLERRNLRVRELLMSPFPSWV